MTVETNIPIFDLSGALQRLEQDEELLREVIELFFSTSDHALAQLTDAIKENNPVKLSGEAHSIKGALANVGAIRASKIAFELERLGKSGILTGASDSLDSLKAEVKKFQAEYKKLLKSA